MFIAHVSKKFSGSRRSGCAAAEGEHDGAACRATIEHVGEHFGERRCFCGSKGIDALAFEGVARGRSVKCEGCQVIEVDELSSQ